MKNIPGAVTYKTSEMLESIKTLKFILISLRKIGDYSIDAREFDIKNEIYDFIVEYEVLNKLADIRMTIESEFDDFPWDGDQDFLEKATENIKYWTHK